MRAARWVGLVLALIAICAVALALGTIHVPLDQLWPALTGEGDQVLATVVRTLRAPRIALAVLVGASLGMSGCALQGTLRNTLAEPYLLGVSGGAAVGAVLAVTLAAPAGAIPFAAFAGSIAAVALTVFVTRAAGVRGDPRSLIMAGVVVGAFANAAIMVLLANAPANTVRGALWWMMGSVSDATYSGVLLLAPYIAVGGALLIMLGRQIDVLALGPDAAAGLGLDVDHATQRIFIAAALLAAATVAGAGLIGFIGLVVPHIARAFGMYGHRQTMLASGLIGAGLLVASDLIARIAMPPAELPLGAVTALVGVPFLLARLRRLT